MMLHVIHICRQGAATAGVGVTQLEKAKGKQGGRGDERREGNGVRRIKRGWAGVETGEEGEKRRPQNRNSFCGTSIKQ